MTCESNNFCGFSLNSPKKTYSAMKILELGNLANLTQQNTNRPYADNQGGSRRTPRGGQGA